MNTRQNMPLNLDPLYIPGMIEDVQTDGAVGGVNYHLLHANTAGLLVVVQAYLNMQENDWIEVFWGDDDNAVASNLVLPEDVGEDFGLFIPANRVPEGVSEVYAKVTRSGGGNGGESPPLAILVRTLFPGGTDPEPDLPGHQNLPAPEPELPPGEIIDEDAAKNGIKVSIGAYPNMRRFDTITFSWGGILLDHEVSQAEVDAGVVEILVSEDTILAAGDSDQLVLVYKVADEVHNPSSDWSVRTYVAVEIGKDLFNAPIIENPDPEADPYDVIDLDLLGEADLMISVYAEPGGKLQIGDVVAPKWTGTTAQGQPITVEPAPKTVLRIPINLEFLVPNADVRQLARGRGVASYSVTRDDSPAGASKRSFVTFLGEEQLLPKPAVSDAVDGVLDPGLAETTVIVPGEALEAGDKVRLTWLGIRANQTPLIETIDRLVSGGSAGEPMSFAIEGATLIAPLEGGSVSVYYTLFKASGLELESAREQLGVGETRAELPAPVTRPPAQDGVLDPEDLSQELAIVVAPWPHMAAGQTVYVQWRASSGPQFNDFIPISAPLVGEEVVFYLDKAHVEANLGANIEITYRVESPDAPGQVSEASRFVVDRQLPIDAGPLRIMGARYDLNVWRGPTRPRILSALHDQSLRPMIAAWRYEDSQRWTAASEWLDVKPWLKLYVRSSTETWECRAMNITGNGEHLNGTDGGAFVAMRDEVMDGDEGVVDMIAWGDPNYGGTLDVGLIDLDTVVEVSSSGNAFAARLRAGDVACWGKPGTGKPEMIYGDYVQVRGARDAFVGRRRDGELFSWGDSPVVPVPEHVLQHKDYINLYGAAQAFAALRKSGHVVAWGDPHNGGQMRQGQERLDDIIDVLGGLGAFIALRDLGDGKSVIGWGESDQGGLIPEDIARLTNVRRLAATSGSTFCIQLETGAIMAWPKEALGGDLPDAIARLTNVVEVTSTSQAYCARLSTGQVVAWGNEPVGGKLTSEAAGKSNIVQVTGNFGAFAALCSDGTVVAWGQDYCGADTSAVAGYLVDVRAIYANGCAFTALTKDGRVVTWGTRDGGGYSGPVQPDLTGRVTTRRLLN